MKPVIALVGRPNVGKSTIFNRMTRSRDALVADQPGLTRDRHYGIGKVGERPFIVVDTGGLNHEAINIDELMQQQVMQAVAEADVLLFVVDGRDGLLAGDEAIIAQLRPFGKRIVLVVNKTEGQESVIAGAEFQVLGLSQCHAISAAHNHGIGSLVEAVLEPFPADDEEDDEHKGIRIAVVGRPNVGKSTLVNRILGEERVVAFDQPGTTRDSIFIPFERDDQHYVLIDTAGVRRRSRVSEAIEKFSIIKTLQAISSAHVVILVLDAHQNISDQDARLLGMVIDSGKALVIAVNKWDGLSSEARDKIREELDRKLSFVDYAKCHFISALHGSGVGDLYPSIEQGWLSSTRKQSTPNLTRLLQQAVQQHAPPLVRGRRIKLRYAHQGGHIPPLIIIHGNQIDAVPTDYKRYLENYFRNALKLEGTPIRIEFKGGDNPYKDKRKVPDKVHAKKRQGAKLEPTKRQARNRKKAVRRRT